MRSDSLVVYFRRVKTMVKLGITIVADKRSEMSVLTRIACSKAWERLFVIRFMAKRKRAIAACPTRSPKGLNRQSSTPKISVIRDLIDGTRNNGEVDLRTRFSRGNHIRRPPKNLGILVQEEQGVFG